MLLTLAVALPFYQWLADLLYFENNIIHTEERTRGNERCAFHTSLKVGYHSLAIYYYFILLLFFTLEIKHIR